VEKIVPVQTIVERIIEVPLIVERVVEREVEVIKLIEQVKCCCNKEVCYVSRLSDLTYEVMHAKAMLL
jgi:hypothetical protein